MLIRVIAAAFANLIFLHVFSQTTLPVSIIPKPVSLKTKPGTFVLDKNTKIVVKDEGDRDAADFFNDYLQKFYGLSLDISGEVSGKYISFSTRKFVKAPENDEHYTLNGSP